ncbi:MAG: type I methionyl aminopeptidase [bacterium]|nr:type I methionyl aminopeptidase [bacterium]
MITIKSPEEISIMREGGKILATVLKEIGKMAKPGVATIDLDRAAEALILKYGAKPSFKGYHSFPHSACISINEEVVHCFPSNRILKEGDIVSLDLGAFYKGYHTDMAKTVAVGKISYEAKRLILVTRKALKRGIKKVKIGNTIGDIGNTVQRYVEGQGLAVIRDLCGHGIGKDIHEDPAIPNFGKRGHGEKLLEGMVICIEPMVVVGDYHIKKAKDGYGFSSKDDSLAAHFEHTIAITKKGPKVLTEI